MNNSEAEDLKEKLNIDMFAIELQRYYSSMGGKVFFALFSVIVFAGICLIRFGNKNDYLLLFLGSMFSLLGMMCYIIASLRWGIKNKKGWLPMFLAVGGLIPWVFSLYLVFTRGLVVLFNIRTNFSLSSLIISLFSIYIGYIIVSINYKIIIAEKRMKARWNSIMQIKVKT